MSVENVIIGKRLPIVEELKNINPAKIYDGIMEVIFREESAEVEQTNFFTQFRSTLQRFRLFERFKRKSK